MAEIPELEAELADSLGELSELGELWLEQRAAGKDRRQVDIAIVQVDKESRKLERKLRKVRKRVAQSGQVDTG